MPDSEREAELLDAERRLQAAQRAGDVPALDDLLDDHLIAVGPDGGRYTKEADLAAHRSGASVIDDLVEEGLELIVEGTTGVTFFMGRVSGRFDGEPFAARLRYTRTWVHDDDRGWRILAAHISPA
ncbi:nuclear transport factor 2 family protein [Micromonospora sp. WMMD812]|uniref:nuclear transport factor 2 family protein n=1 Tax=Micromonospora sp. WMMD812 TaxID=3015152 RepID=UPI00248CEE14|nr:nuclear transport factor 2 family protein [Micromonospora sp. WMMD812]WBB68743.1 nuclear transport factor 2 family protein [Micromonospora sp. WMMD812]